MMARPSLALSDKAWAALAYVRAHSGCSAADVGEAIGSNADSVLITLIDHGLVGRQEHLPIRSRRYGRFTHSFYPEPWE